MLDRAQVVHVARLARLQLDESELARMEGELSAVLDHVERIRELDLEGVAPTAHAAMGVDQGLDPAGVMRADEPVAGLTHEQALSCAPEPVEGGFGVPSPGPGEQ